ncbi:hypothetical protein [Tropicimonas sp. IMCC34011]|uniref:hypothetical protein n=1 Tax=Tropicimonas sp. IMCC34011 TaxID=2248759 RepID=UPI00130045C6|nr:hypothetical protein [Tropicimonas sp. IMCC34011]
MAKKPLDDLLCGRKRFGNYTVLGDGAKDPKDRMVKCLCDCGVVKDVSAAKLRTGRSTCCKGCAALSKNRVTNLRHGQSSSPEYKAWRSMKQRCRNPRAHNYEAYGGRGIDVCDRWFDSFEAFLDDIGAKPTAEHSLDRIDNDGNYEPGNVRWATAKAQAWNRRNTTKIGNKVIAEIAHKARMSPATLAVRLKAGWSMKDATTRPVEDRRPKHRVFGEDLTAAQIAEKYDVPRQRLNYRLRKGMSAEEAIKLG